MAAGLCCIISRSWLASEVGLIIMCLIPDKLHQSDQFIRQNCEEKMKVLIEMLELFRKDDSSTINVSSTLIVSRPPP